MSTRNVLEGLGIPPNGGAQFVDTASVENHARLHIFHSNTLPQFHATYRTHVTDYPSEQGFHVNWRGFLFFDDHQVVTYKTTTHSEFPDFSTRQFFLLRRALRRGRTLPEAFQHAMTIELECLWSHLYTWKRLP